MDSYGSGQESRANSCGHCNEPSGSMFFNQQELISEQYNGDWTVQHRGCDA
jgi:hypothetical protein